MSAAAGGAAAAAYTAHQANKTTGTTTINIGIDASSDWLGIGLLFACVVLIFILCRALRSVQCQDS
jgi:hypothetical protein